MGDEIRPELLRVGEVREFRGEQLREIGLYPGAPMPELRMRVTDVHDSTITVEAVPMPDQIEPALTAEEWARIGSSPSVSTRGFDGAIQARAGDSLQAGSLAVQIHDRPAAVIALVNTTLPDNRRITREKISALRTAVDMWISESSRPSRDEPIAEMLRVHLDALETYLPPI